MHRLAPRASRLRWLWAALVALLALAPLAFWDGGVIEREALGFQRNYWGSRPVLQRVFETREFDDYQGRELSYAVDCLDAQWIRALLSRAVFVFVAPSVLLASLAMVPIGLWLLPAALPGLDRPAGWLVLLLYLSNFAVASTAGLLYRATKPLVAALLLLLLLLLLAEQRRPRLGSLPGFAVIFAPSLAMSLLDRQGLFYLLLLAGVIAMVWLRTRRGLVRLLALGAAILACLLYNELIGPWLIHSLNGYWPDKSFQQLDPRWLLTAGPWVAGARLLGDWTRVLVGGIPPTLLLAAAAAAFLAWAWRRRAEPRRLALSLALLCAAVLAQLSMVALMAARYPTITWIDHRFWYYPLPFQALVVFALLCGLERLALVRGSQPRAVTILLATLVLANLAQWPERRQIMQSGPWFSEVARSSALLVRSWRAGRPALLLDGEYRRFYFESLVLFPRLLARSSDYVAEGKGVGLVDVRDGRLSAPARREAHLPVTVRDSGRYVLLGSVVLPPGTTLSISLGPRLLGELHAEAPQVGPRPDLERRFRVTTRLAAGRSDFLLRARLPKRGDTERRGFELQLPFLVWRDEEARADTFIF